MTTQSNQIILKIFTKKNIGWSNTLTMNINHLLPKLCIGSYLISICLLVFGCCILYLPSHYYNTQNVPGSIKSHYTLTYTFYPSLASKVPPGLPGVPLPAHLHQTLHVKPTQRVIIVGDVHGCLDELNDLLEKVCFEVDKDVLLLTGDMVNKGPKSLEVIRFIQQIRGISVRGNHEDLALDAYFNGNQVKDLNQSYVERLSKNDLRWIMDLPYTISIPIFNTIVVHAGLLPGRQLQHQLPYYMYNMRDVYPKNISPHESSLEFSKFLSSLNEIEWIPDLNHWIGFPWAQVWNGPHHIVFGHDSKRGLQIYKSATGIDTGCVDGFNLTALVLPERTIHNVKAKKKYSDRAIFHLKN